jgi:ribosome-interacting GTPase 1
MDNMNVTMLNAVNDIAGEFLVKVRVIRVWRQWQKLDPTQVFSVEAILMDENVSHILFKCKFPFF